MNQKVQELRSQIALIDLQITEIQSLQNIVKAKALEAEASARAKLKKVKALTETKLSSLNENHPKRKLVAEKIEAMKMVAKQRIEVIKTEYDSYEKQIEVLNSKSASLTKEMLALID